MTKDEILAMEPGRELDAVVGKTFGYEPKFQWWAMDKEEKVVFITFEWKSDADTWFKEQSERFPKWVEDNGCHIVKMEIHRNFSESISAAYEVVEKIKSEMQDVTIHDDPYHGCKVTISLIAWASAKTAPEAICKAALLACLEETS